MLTPGQRLGPYEVVDSLGAGGMGEVYRARDPRLGRDVAVKVVRSSGVPEPDRLERFEREARAVAALSHPNVLTVHDVGHENGHPYVVFELLEGETLRGRLERGPLPMRRSIEVAVEVCRGLEPAHGRELVHRDLKPENVFLTTDGRVKILDFGLAKLRKGEGIGELAGDERLEPGGALAAPADDTRTADGVILGTLGYLSPEQARGLTADARSDLFALGAVLYEMLSGRRAFKGKTPADTLSAILQKDPPALGSGSGPLPSAAEQIVRRCLAKEPDERFHSAHDLALALETLLERSGSGGTPAGEDQDREPYPGLASFGEEDSRRFFGREGEAEALWRRLRDRKLLAVIGPSGAGKTSFVRAGVVASRPSGWGAVVATPGTSPLSMLGQALAPALASDPQALPQLVRFEDPGVAYEVLTRWRRSHERALLVVDQFEELFTLNPPEVQERFASLLGRLSSEGDVTVLLSMRDDFLMRCQDHEALAPVFDSLTPLGPLSGAALRRALEEPATAEGFRFEEGLVDTMLQAVEGERGALPLLAFAVSRLWEHRDRERHLLTHEAYGDIGGVAGALARHAEATLERIGPDRRPVVREIFRNLATSQETRAVVEREELLSVFPDRAVAAEVLDELIRSRLLTSYESTTHTHRIEIVHESLLTSWLRLVRWQAQDAAGALLRDQLKQAARLWDDRGRPEDLLWTGASYLEFRAWRARYPGGLSSLEDDFARAMTAHANRRRRRRRIAVAAVVALLSAGLATVTGFWARAEAESRRREAAQLLALGRGQLAEEPTSALAFALASLERADNEPARRFAVEALWQGPTVLNFALEQDSWGTTFSRDGRWAAVSGAAGVFLWSRDGRSRGRIVGPEGPAMSAHFSPDSRSLLTWTWGGVNLARVWSIPDGELLRSHQGGPTDVPMARGGSLFFASPVGDSAQGGPREWDLSRWSLAGGERHSVGRVAGAPYTGWAVDREGKTLLEVAGGRLRARPVERPEAPWRTVRRDLPPDARLGQGGVALHSSAVSGSLRVWSVTDEKPPLVLRGAESPPILENESGSDLKAVVDPAGRFVSAPGVGARLLWDLQAPPEAQPLRLRRATRTFDLGLWNDFVPGSEWLPATRRMHVDLWSVGMKHPHVLRMPDGVGGGAEIDPHGRFILSTATDERTGGEVRLWPLTTEWGTESRVLYRDPRLRGGVFFIEPKGRFAVGTLKYDGKLVVLPFDGGPPRYLEGFGWTYWAVIDSEGRRVASNFTDRTGQRVILRVWDLESGESWDLDPVIPDESCLDGSFHMDYVWTAGFLPDGRLVSDGMTGLRVWDVERGTSRQVRAYGKDDCGAHIPAMTPDGSEIFIAPWSSGNATRPVVATNVETGEGREIDTDGGRLWALRVSPSGRWLATGDKDGLVRLVPLGGGEPHLFYGHTQGILTVDVSRDGRWVVSSSADGTIRLWPVPEGPPLQTLPYEELLAKLRTFTNLRAVPDPASATGYTVEPGPFPGWANPPEW